MRKTIVVAGVLIDVAGQGEVLDAIESLVVTGRATGKAHQVATVNTQFVMNAWLDETVRRILHRVDLSTCDGKPLEWASRALGARTERVTGVDLVPDLAERAAARGFSIFLFGAQPDVAQRAAEVLKERNPGLRIAGILSPPNVASEEIDEEILAQIGATKPDILLVALGSPKQEKWIATYSPKLPGTVSIGIGGTFDFIAGMTRRAPGWVQAVGMEWAFRLVQEPRRLWRRYLLAGVYFPSILLYQLWLLMRMGASKAGNPDPLGAHGLVAEQVTAANASRLHEQVLRALQDGHSVTLDFRNVRFIDSVALGTLAVLSMEARRSGLSLRLHSVSPAVAGLIDGLHFGEVIEIEDRPPQLSSAERALDRA